MLFCSTLVIGTKKSTKRKMVPAITKNNTEPKNNIPVIKFQAFSNEKLTYMCTNNLVVLFVK